MRNVLLLAIRGYQLLLRPYLGPTCRYYPSCSCYAQQAISQHGGWRGLKLSLRRIGRCHPWHEGGYDPVPKRDATNTQDSQHDHLFQRLN